MDKISCLATGIDTLGLNYYGSLRPGVLAQLEDLRKAAELDETRKGVEVLDFYDDAVTEGKTEQELNQIKLECLQNSDVSLKKLRFVFKVMPNAGGKMFRFLLISPDMDIKISAGTSGKTPTLQIVLHSRFLWNWGKGRGWEHAWRQARSVAEEFCLMEREEISRLDMAADFEIVEGHGFCVGDIGNFISQAMFKGPYNPVEKQKPQVKMADGGRWWSYGLNFTGFSFGKGKTIRARCYNKTEEIKGTEKAELFEQVWGVEGRENLGQVWRVEFQLRRDALRSLDLNRVHDLRQADGGLWERLTGRWLSLRVPGRNKQRCRWDVDPRWSFVQSAGGLFRGQQKVRVNRSFRATKGMLISQIRGCTTSLAAIKKQQGVVLTKEEAITEMVKGIYTDWQDTDFENKVCEKEYRFAQDGGGQLIKLNV